MKFNLEEVLICGAIYTCLEYMIVPPLGYVRILHHLQLYFKKCSSSGCNLKVYTRWLLYKPWQISIT